MSLDSFRTYQTALEFYRMCEKLTGPLHLIDQLHRASSSVALNLSEGSAKPTLKDRRRYYYSALGSQRECKTILELMGAAEDSKHFEKCDKLGAQLFQLCKSQNTTADRDRKKTVHGQT